MIITVMAAVQSTISKGFMEKKPCMAKNKGEIAMDRAVRD